MVVKYYARDCCKIAGICKYGIQNKRISSIYCIDTVFSAASRHNYGGCVCLIN
jgi:hypothetical protein